jgi:hypothetical protein
MLYLSANKDRKAHVPGKTACSENDEVFVERFRVRGNKRGRAARYAYAADMQQLSGGVPVP